MNHMQKITEPNLQIYRFSTTFIFFLFIERVLIMAIPSEKKVRSLMRCTVRSFDGTTQYSYGIRLVNNNVNVEYEQFIAS